MASIHRQEELRQVMEELEAKWLKLINESRAKQQELEFELESNNLEVTILHCIAEEKDVEIGFLETQMRANSEEINTLKSQGVELQQQLKEKDIHITAISSELQHNRDNIEVLTDDKQELTSQMISLEARFKEVEFFRNHYSQEVDQLREELMDKKAEIDHLRKQQTDRAGVDTLPSTSPAGL